MGSVRNWHQPERKWWEVLTALSQTFKVACAAVSAFGFILLTFALLQYVILPALIAITDGGP